MHAPVALVAASILMALPPVHAQERTDSGGPAIYKVEFNIHEGSDAAAKSGRRYTLLTSGNRKSVFKVGNRVPVATGSFQPGVGGVGVNPMVNTQFTYIDVGVNIECQVNEMNGRLLVHGNIDLSTVVQNAAEKGSATPSNPTVGQTRLDLDTAVEPGKPTVIASIDDPVNMRKLQVEATVTKVN